MERVILARHAESEFSVRNAVNGDPSREGGGLTAAGRRQARALGQLLADDAIDLCVTSEFARARETADIALAGRSVPRLVVPELNDIRFGSFEGGPLADYRRWAHTHGPEETSPGGGESRAEACRRFAAGFRILLARPEPTILVVAHALPIRYLLSALIEQDPSAVVEPVPYAETHRFSAPQLKRAIERLEAWCANPVFA
jgi:2,3-bisphosphoglycerate-dependent phosphoglycerate mutase